MKFVVGLGNPGKRYATTRHNLGFMVVETLVCKWQVGPGRNAFGGLLYEAGPARPDCGRRRVMLLTPQTYMNCSGRAVGELAGFYKAERQDILVVLDDMALPTGRLRARARGSAGGHNGLADVLAALGGEDVQRLRIGIGPPPGRMDAMDFVLRPFEPDELEMIRQAVKAAAEAVEDWVFNGMDYVMEKYNRKDEN
jgi:PTH1 family peptidyl-tRNA hydrolase